ncbi:MAG: hypothetical protein VSS52_011115, partial [Thiotrichaceae bacterium]|nr:hypothetical protein [Thiotrichaceae bacterium]
MMKTKRFDIPIYLRFIFAFLLLFAVKTGFSAETVACETSWFNSGEGVKARDQVTEYKEAGIFTQDEVCHIETRKDFTYILITALEKHLDRDFRKTLLEGNPPFIDISLAEVKFAKFERAIKQAYGDGNTSPTSKFGILSVESHKKFRPNDFISRIEALVMTVRAYEDFCGKITDEDYFSDHDSAESWMQSYLAKGKAQHLSKGYFKEGQYTNYFSPNKQVPRHETVGFVQKLVDQIEQCGGTTTDD